MWNSGVEINTSSPFTVNFVMFLPTLINQCTPEQQEEWVKRVFSNEIIGTYAQVMLNYYVLIYFFYCSIHTFIVFWVSI